MANNLLRIFLEKPAEAPKQEETPQKPAAKKEIIPEQTTIQQMGQKEQPKASQKEQPKSITSPLKLSEPFSIMNQSLRTEERVPMNRLRKRIAERLKSAQNTAAALTTFQEVDMGNIMAMRFELQKEFEQVHGMKFGEKFRMIITTGSD